MPSASSAFAASSEIFKNFYNSGNPQKTTFSIREVPEDFVFKELTRLNIGKSTGLDGLPARFIRDGAEFLKRPITVIVNKSILTGVVPEDMKSARVRPIFKKNSPLDVNNYRPVSILSIVSKILELAVYCQLNDFLNCKNLLYQFQSGFREKYSTDTCLIHLLDYIKRNTAKGLYTGMVVLDLQKAFDTVDHDILCQKLEEVGIVSVGWFRSYLSDRQQVVTVAGATSSPGIVTCGVPQGSILGPLLFLCYANDMATSIEADCKLILYANDSAIIFVHKDPKVISQKLSKVMESYSEWLISLHLGKTECVLFGPQRKLKKVEHFTIFC